MTIYRGLAQGECGGQLVTKDDDILSPVPSQKVYKHSPDGFQWGYGGSGPAQLALALLLDVTGDPAVSLGHHQNFKWQFVARWPQGKDWVITDEEIRAWMKNDFHRVEA